MTDIPGRLLPLAAALALSVAGPALAQAPAAAPAPAAQGLDPDAEAALNRMGAALRAMQSFEVVSDATTETVYDGNHKLQSLMRTTYTVQFPDRMTIDMRGDRTHRRVYYDGKRMTLVALKAGKYVTFPVQGSVSDVLAAAYEDYGLEFPLQDLFRWGSPNSDVVRPTTGFRVGDAMIGDTRVSHYSFRQPGVDFQVWLEDGAQALPRKMVITNTEHPAQPQYVAYFRWNRAPELTADTFTFTPGPNDKLIDFGTAKAAMSAK